MSQNQDQNQEQVYQCQECKTIHWETKISVRPISKVLFCYWCQSENIRVIVEK